MWPDNSRTHDLVSTILHSIRIEYPDPPQSLIHKNQYQISKECFIPVIISFKYKPLNRLWNSDGLIFKKSFHVEVVLFIEKSKQSPGTQLKKKIERYINYFG